MKTCWLQVSNIWTMQAQALNSTSSEKRTLENHHILVTHTKSRLGCIVFISKLGHFKTHDHFDLKSHCWKIMRPSHFTLELCRPKRPREFEWMKTLMESYMTCSGYSFMVYRILHQTHLFEMGLTQNLKTVIFQNLKLLISYCVKNPHE